MMIGGVSIILILGILNIFLILFQISTGLRWIGVPFHIHRKTAIILFFSAALHGVLAIFASYG
jgi:hypothetical protein